MDVWRSDARWGSGAALALVAAVSGLLTHLSLRADSVGPAPALSTLVIGGAVLTAVLWPLAARSTRVVTLAAVLLVAQFGTHALTLLAAGAPVGNPRGLICCPPTEATSDGLVGRLTAQAGWTLVAVQALACLLLAAVIRGSRAGADLLATAFALVTSVFSVAGVLAGRVLRWLRLLGAPTAPAWVRPAPYARPSRLRDPGALLARCTGRRGPPCRPAPVLSLAAG